LSSLKDGGVQSQNLRVIAERIFILDNSFRGSKDAIDLSNEYLNQFKTVFSQKPQALTKNESIDLVVHAHAKTYSGAESNSNAILKIIFDKHF
jgi:hypothetical protein